MYVHLRCSCVYAHCICSPMDSAAAASSGACSAGPPRGSPLLALEWKAFDYKFDGDFTLGGLPVLLPPCAAAARAPHKQQHGDTGKDAFAAQLFAAAAQE